MTLKKKLILFDLDGTLIDSVYQHVLAWQDALDQIEAAVDRIEDGNFGGKGSDAHKASVVGDTVGDPFKDTAGPAINFLTSFWFLPQKEQKRLSLGSSFFAMLFLRIG